MLGRHPLRRHPLSPPPYRCLGIDGGYFWIPRLYSDFGFYYDITIIISCQVFLNIYALLCKDFCKELQDLCLAALIILLFCGLSCMRGVRVPLHLPSFKTILPFYMMGRAGVRLSRENRFYKFLCAFRDCFLVCNHKSTYLGRQGHWLHNIPGFQIPI